jgi:hypothetical protein
MQQGVEGILLGYQVVVCWEEACGMKPAQLSLEDQPLVVMGTLILVQGVLLLDQGQSLAQVLMGCLSLHGILFYHHVPFTNTMTWMIQHHANNVHQGCSLSLKVLLNAKTVV